MQKQSQEESLSKVSLKKPRTLSEYLLSLYKDPLTFSNSIEGLYQVALKHNHYNFNISKENV